MFQCLLHHLYTVQRAETFIGVIFLDLDAFKSANDTMGHNARVAVYPIEVNRRMCLYFFCIHDSHGIKNGNQSYSDISKYSFPH
ncbi:diguanylate cyclase [Acetobacterium paludosum]|uniref:Diguanylate cyclase n=1 Tax=Acetobacterium paludosum TaxID=52693 RepID=A0A923HWC2_9FIRM|nr:diguanylate cyclase [Acetobacterium paludosum]